MEAKAVAKYIKRSPRKVREVVDVVRGKRVRKALPILDHTKKHAAEDVEQVIMSAVSNARDQDPDVDVDSLVINEIYVDEGPTDYRWRPRAMGRATQTRKRSSHITVKLKEDI